MADGPHSPAGVERGLVDLRDVLARAIDLIGGEVRQRARFVEDIPRLPKVFVNEGQLTQVVVDLLRSAAQAIAEGHADANEVSVTGRSEAGWVILEIHDTGAGTPPEGSGAGLSTCQGLLKGMGGGIERESEGDGGTLVRVRVPAAPSGARAAAAHLSPPGSSPVRARLLVVDDDARLARSIKALLEDAHDVDIETSAVRACARLIGGEDFDVILCDLMMRELNGMDLYEKLSEGRPSETARIVFMTGGAFTGRAQAFLDRVDNACLDKPFARAELLGAIADCLAAAGPRPAR